MDYEKKYNEALEHARAEILANPGLRKTWEEIFPELRESEDERIRKALVWHLKADVDFVSNGVTKAECIAYLEKQKEDKEELVYRLNGLMQDYIKEGKRLMMEEAEECELYWDGDFLAIDLNMAALGYSERDKVRVIVCKKEDEK